MAAKRNTLTYRDAGVDIAAGGSLVDRIKPAVASTQRPGTVGGLGGFGALFDLKAAGWRDPMLVAATDGVGTKLKIAIDTGESRSIGIDLANPEGHAVLAELVGRADVFLTNFLPDARRKLGIEVDDIRALSPDIIYARGSGHGARGPEAEKGGFDHTSFWARAGIAHAATMVTGEFIPQVGPAFGDLMSGFSLASGITAAISSKGMK